MQIRDFLSEQSARAVYDELHQLPWGLVYNDGANVVQWRRTVSPSSMAGEAARIMAGIQERARSQYQFLYSYFPLLTAYFSPNSPRFGVFDFYEFINSPRTWPWSEQVTGLANIRWADGQATWYRPGTSSKRIPTKKRRPAGWPPMSSICRRCGTAIGAGCSSSSMRTTISKRRSSRRSTR